MVTRYEISNDILNWIINQVRFSYEASPALEELESWREGLKKPTFNQIDHVSKSTHIPLGYFFLSEPPEETTPLLKFRTIKSKDSVIPSRNLIETIDEMEQVIDWTRNYLQSEGTEKNVIVGSMKREIDPIAIADYIRKILGLSLYWFEGVSNSGDAFKRIRERISEQGIMVMMNGIVKNNTKRPLAIEEFRAFAIADEDAPLIFINGADSNNGRLFSLLHEFVHICLGVDDLYNTDYSDENGTGDCEAICNAVASEVLVPTDVFREKWKTVFSLDVAVFERIKKLALYFRCSEIVIARKALDSRFITKRDYKIVVDKTIENYSTFAEKKSKGGDYYRTMGTRIDRRFFNMIFDSVSRGTTQYTEAFRLTNTNRMTFMKLAEGMYL